MQFDKRNYEMFISVGLMARKMHPVNIFFNTNTGPNLIREDFLEAGWVKSVQRNSQTTLRISNSQKVSVIGKIPLQLRMSGC